MLKKLLKITLSVASAVLVYDAGKHVFINSQIEKLCKKHEEKFKAEAVSFSFKPFQCSVIIKNITTARGVKVSHLNVRQDILALDKLTVDAEKISATPLSFDRFVGHFKLSPSIFKWAGDEDLILSAKDFDASNIELTLPKLTLTSKIAKMPWSYNLKTHMLKLALTVDDIVVKESDPAHSFGINGSAEFNLEQKPLDGEMTLNVKRLSHLTNAFEVSGILDKTQTKLLSFGFALLGKDKDQVPVPLRIKSGTVFLGPFPIYQIDSR